ncbi:Endonuclease/Exonuclease/phosphatase family protein [Novipirellula galeiformis]|uniref:Endonuclease/Exonuclease/phosphatase family protein n=1 Tax=Novipirellula galeiformis TaxID=2528004 RepID=A0A5C6CPW8_9BACT|nr:endonuclease/exonuclease/phosphatase family protein [Novipirellula galeiformis]TWU26590.1 Endonuclease/Exonuclease/phosphatase family protein [Novipirellula galeiformis]
MKMSFIAILACLIVTTTSADETSRLMSYNIRYLSPNDGKDHWDHRVDDVAKAIQQADIVGLQEATRKQIDDLAARLPDFYWYGLGRSDGADGGEFSPLFWRRDQFDVVRKGTFWLGPDPGAIGMNAWGANLPRICSWIEIHAKSNPQRWLLMNTHFDHQSAQARENSAKLLRSKAAELRDNLDVVVMGDLNALPKSRPLQHLLAGDLEGVTFFDSIAQSAAMPTGPQGTFNGFKKLNLSGRIDYILLSDPKANVTTHQTLDPRTSSGRFASDHQAVMITIASPAQ